MRMKLSTSYRETTRKIGLPRKYPPAPSFRWTTGLIVLLLLIGKANIPSSAEAKYDPANGTFILERSDMEECVTAQEERKIYMDRFEENLKTIDEWQLYAKELEKNNGELGTDLEEARSKVKFFQDTTMVVAISGLVLTIVAFIFGAILL
jgi:hypothetical protein